MPELTDAQNIVTIATSRQSDRLEKKLRRSRKETLMTLTHLCEIDFYIDGELDPEDACEVEARLESDTRLLALFDAAWRQKETVARALETLDMQATTNRRTAALQTKLANALSLRLLQAHHSHPKHPALKTT